MSFDDIDRKHRPKSAGPGFDAIDRRFKPEAPQSASAYCPKCENGGWEYYGLGHHDPHFRECTACGNPDKLPCP